SLLQGVTLNGSETPATALVGRRPHARDQWMVNDQPAFGWIPAGIHPRVEDATPIHLYHGDPRNFGAAHLEKHRHYWGRFAATPPEWVWLKCQQSGRMFLHEDSDRKLKVMLTLNPAALLILEHRPEHQCFSVVSLHPRPQGWT